MRPEEPFYAKNSGGVFSLIGNGLFRDVQLGGGEGHHVPPL